MENTHQNEVGCKKWMKRNEIMRMLKENEIRCGVSMMALLYANQFYL